MCRRGLRLDHPKHIAELTEYVRQNDIRLLILDPLARMHTAEENDASSMKPVVEALRGLSRLTTVILVAHYRKNVGGKNSRPGQLVRGSSDLWAAGRTVLGFEWKGEEIRLTPNCHYMASAEPLRLRFVEEQYDADTKCGRFVLVGSGEAPQPDSDSLEGRILSTIRNGGAMTTTQVRDLVQGGHGKIQATLESLEAAGTIVSSIEQRPDKKGRSRSVKVWSLCQAAEPGTDDDESESGGADEEVDI